MTVYRIANDSERNGYNDSDWTCRAFDSETGQLVQVETGTTRFANALQVVNPDPLPLSLLPDALAARATQLAAAMLAADRVATLEPWPQGGERVRLTRQCKSRNKASGGWLVYPAGAAGEVVRTESHGTFYRNGYNRPGRYNSRSLVRWDPAVGAKYPAAWIACEALRLDREPMSEAEAAERGREQAGHESRGWVVEGWTYQGLWRVWVAPAEAQRAG